jgi:hypothetical protein
MNLPDDEPTATATAASIDALEPLLRAAVEALDSVAKEVVAPGLASEAVRLAQAVSTARSALYTELVRQGWVPPELVPAGIEMDLMLLTQHLGAGYDATYDSLASPAGGPATGDAPAPGGRELPAPDRSIRSSPHAATAG